MLDSGRVIAPGEIVRHTCDVRRCVNPEHLIVGTVGENNVDTAQRAQRHATLKLWPSDVLNIRKRLDNGERGADLAREYGVGKSTISRIKHNKCWWHV